jgi:hypothetical protein
MPKTGKELPNNYKQNKQRENAVSTKGYVYYHKHQ